MKKLSIALLLVVLLLGGRSAEAMNGHDLIEGMNSYLKAERDYTKSDYLLAGNYMGYVQGVAEATVTDYSLPSGVTPDTLYKIVADYLQKNPEKRDKPAAFLVRSALLSAYPKYLIRNQ
ncbi:MAG TPA: Rap1a/Tai family immunity protein [Smithellaceae bacterium]|nr:Rap1a/Tai family immunity protein [Smithellaceae bacterium]HRS82603.1 Rap1a/Tai family immunity protein [Smithellaceae bacterium]HRV44096.1 Rap1a/Tai family immunity protein [Smithellaceae bacterium]